MERFLTNEHALATGLIRLSSRQYLSSRLYYFSRGVTFLKPVATIARSKPDADRALKIMEQLAKNVQKSKVIGFARRS